MDTENIIGWGQPVTGEITLQRLLSTHTAACGSSRAPRLPCSDCFCLLALLGAITPVCQTSRTFDRKKSLMPWWAKKKRWNSPAIEVLNVASKATIKPISSGMKVPSLDLFKITLWNMQTWQTMPCWAIEEEQWSLWRLGEIKTSVRFC